ncbi:MAG: transposase [Pontixanthobacter sp.]
MPPILDCKDDAAIGLDDCVENLDRIGFDAQDETSIDYAAQCLRQLGNNPEFLADILLAELKGHYGTDHDSAYGPQSIVLSDLRRGFFIRANIWPSPQDSIFRASGAHSFAYGAAHDHNFDFLTLGYFGPGYASDYWEYDYSAVAGYAGEAVDLKSTGRHILSPGTIRHYRAHRDVHSQLPPESLSVSLNIMAVDPAQAWHDQYGFDVEQGRISGVLNPTSTELFVRLAAGLGGEDCTDLVEHFGTSHPSDRIRLASFQARSLLLPDASERDRLWADAESSGSRLVAAEAAAMRAALA